MKRLAATLIIAFLIACGVSFQVSAQSRAERKKARKMDRIERKAERKVKRRDELTASAQAAYGTEIVMRKPKYKNKNSQKIRKRDRQIKPAKGTQTNALPWIFRRKHS